MKILVVDDDPVARAVLEAELRALGHEPEGVGGGEEAWSRIAAGGIRVVVCDWLMPGLDGLALCERIRAARGDYVYFILLTQMEHSRINSERAINAGVDDFLAKPVNAHELWMRLHVAERLLGFTRKVRELEAILPICGYCKKIRDDRNYWNQIERYIGERTGASFSHSICPDCMKGIVEPELERLGVPRRKPHVDRVE